LLREAAGPGRPLVLEVGAGGSRILPYLGRQFGHKIFGSDFSFGGCRLLRANLDLQKLGGSVVCEDLFRSSLKSETFDLVYSSGLIEHFDDTQAVIHEHLKLMKPGGRLVLTVPNLQGLQGRIVRRLAPSLWSIHKVFGPPELAEILKAAGLQEVRGGYLGSFFVRVLRSEEWSVVRRWPLAMQLLVCSSLRLVNGLISLGFRLVPWRPQSRTLSPTFFALGTKPQP
jgi:SAM-dependent methyltransferase